MRLHTIQLDGKDAWPLVCYEASLGISKMEIIKEKRLVEAAPAVDVVFDLDEGAVVEYSIPEGPLSVPARDDKVISINDRKLQKALDNLNAPTLQNEIFNGVSLKVSQVIDDMLKAFNDNLDDDKLEELWDIVEWQELHPGMTWDESMGPRATMIAEAYADALDEDLEVDI